MKSARVLNLSIDLPLRALNAGLFVSRGVGTHPTRVIDSHELIFVSDGVLSIREESARFEVSAGQSLILVAGRAHGGTRDYPPDLRFYWIHFALPSREGAGRAGKKPLRAPQCAAVSRPERLVELFRWFLDDQESGRLQPAQAALLVGQMLIEVADRRPTAAPAERTAALLASRADEYVKLHFHEPIGTAEIARALRCNPDYLGHVFGKIYGQPLTEAIHRRRVRHARRLLLEREANIDEVARRSGYEDPGYFRRMFKRIEGLTPGAFRRLYSRMHINTE